MLADPFSTPITRLLPALNSLSHDEQPVPVLGGMASGASQPGHNRLVLDDQVFDAGVVDILVNNAGTTEFIPADDFEAVNDEVWSRLMDVNVKAAFQCVRAARPHLEAAGSAEIVSVASVAAFTS